MIPVKATQVCAGDMVYIGRSAETVEFVGMAQEVYQTRTVAVLITMSRAGARFRRSYHKDHVLFVIRTDKDHVE